MSWAAAIGIATLMMIILACTPRLARKGVLILIIAALGLSVLYVGLWREPRWMVVVAGAAWAMALAVPICAYRRRDVGSASRWRRVGITAYATLIAVIACAAGVAGWALPTARLPEPSGMAQVGTARVQWQRPTPQGNRPIVAQLWYPTDDPGGAPLRPYLGDDADEAGILTAALAQTYGVPAFALDGARYGVSTATVDATPRPGAAMPIVLFSPGLAGVRTQNTAWAQELASRGYLVAALDHPGDSAAMVLEDGSVISSEIVSTGDNDQDQANADRLASTRAADLSSAIDELDRMSREDDQFAGLLDPSRIAVAGHSLGGAAAMLAANADKRVDAVVNLDGLPRGDPSPRVPMLTLVAGTWTGDVDGTARYRDARVRAITSSRCAYEVVVPDVAHLSLTDAAFFLPPLPSLIGSAGRERGPAAAAATAVAFLDATIGDGKVTDITAVLQDWGEVSVRGCAAT